MPAEKRPLKLIRQKSDVDSSDFSGYQAVDYLTVVERKRLALNYDVIGAEHNTQTIATVYDFGKMQVITTVFNQLSDSRNSDTTATSMVQNFNEVQGFQAIMDAHRALTELGGSPPPVEDFSNMHMKTAANVSAPRTASFKRDARP